jgi:glycosyltransferase involved in cell wall biosynthesis
MTNYNYARFLPEALTAIVQQSYRPDEILIIDDASTDNSVEIIERFQREHSNIRLLRNDRNMGVLHNANVLFKQAAGRYVYGAASDDRILPGLIEKSIDILERHPKASMCFSDPATFVDGQGTIFENHLHLASEPSYFGPEDLVELSRRRKLQIASHTALYRLKNLQKIGLIPELRWHSDWFANWVLAFRDGVCYIPEALATIRVHPHSYSASRKRKWSAQAGILDSMLDLLRTEYKDVRPHFQRSAVMWCFKTAMIYAALRTPANRPFLNRLAIQRGLWRELHDFAAGLAPEAFRTMYRIGREKINSSLLTMEPHRQ